METTLGESDGFGGEPPQAWSKAASSCCGVDQGDHVAAGMCMNLPGDERVVMGGVYGGKLAS